MGRGSLMTVAAGRRHHCSEREGKGNSAIGKRGLMRIPTDRSRFVTFAGMDGGNRAD